MSDTIKIQEIGHRVNTFLVSLHNIMQNPDTVTQEDGIALLNTCNGILADLDKLDEPQRFGHFKVQFEMVKRQLQQALMTAPTEE